MMRYADDIIVAVRSEETGNVVRQVVSEFLSERGLELSEEKSKVINIHDGFTFMSRTYKKQGDRLYAKPSDGAVERFMASMKETIDGYTGSQKSLIDKLNKKIDGWVTYHKVTSASAIFRKMDDYIFALLLRLCQKKHPKWTQKMVLDKYWYQDHKGRYCYALPDKKEVHVKFLADTLSYPYVPVRTSLNPYIDWAYFDKRTNERQIRSITGVYRSIWNRQNGKCYYCGRNILYDEDFALVDVDGCRASTAKGTAYVHRRCMETSFEYIETDTTPSSTTELRDLLKSVKDERNPPSLKYYYLSEFFRTCNTSPITLTFDKIESIIGDSLGATALREEYWFRTGFMCISQCWLSNGYEIERLHLDGTKRVVFHITSGSRNTSAITIPSALQKGRIPNEAKYELENYFKYIIKKYGL